MKIVVKHFADPDETITAIPGKVTVHAEMEDGSEESTDVDNLTLGQQLTYVVIPGVDEAYVDDTQIQAVIDPAPPAEGAMCNGKCIGSPNYGVTRPDPDCPAHRHLPSQVADTKSRYVVVATFQMEAEPGRRSDVGTLVQDALRMLPVVAAEPSIPVMTIAPKLQVDEHQVAAVDPGERNAAAIQRLGDAIEDGWVANPEPITPEEAKALHAVWAGDHFDAEHLDTVQPKLEAIAGESWR